MRKTIGDINLVVMPFDHAKDMLGWILNALSPSFPDLNKV